MNFKGLRRKSSLAALPLLLLGAALGRADTPAPTESPESVRALLTKWSETQQIRSKEREEWKQGKEVLISRIELLKGEVAALEGKSTEASKGTQDIRHERQQLLNEAESLKGPSEDLARLAGGVGGRER